MPLASPYRAPATHTVLTGHITPPTVQPGGQLTLVLTATPDPGWHVYALKEGEVDPRGYMPTVIGVRVPSGWTASRPAPSAEPIVEKSDIEGLSDARYHEDAVSWTVLLQAPSDAVLGTYEIAGGIGYQACQTSCDAPAGACFSARVGVDHQPSAGQLPLTLSRATYQEAADLSGQAPSAARGSSRRPIAAPVWISSVLTPRAMPAAIPCSSPCCWHLWRGSS